MPLAVKPYSIPQILEALPKQPTSAVNLPDTMSQRNMLSAEKQTTIWVMTQRRRGGGRVGGGGVPVKTGGCSQACSSGGSVLGLARFAGSSAWKSCPSRVSSTSSSTLLILPCSFTAQAGLYTSGAALARLLRLTTAATVLVTNTVVLNTVVT